MSVQRTAAFGSIAVVVAAVVAGLFILGSPAEQRLLRLDDRRVEDLRSLSRAADFRWTEDGNLPATAPELVDGQSLSRLPVDPSSGQPYEYRITAPRAFEVCGVFERPSRAADAGDFWFHEAGRRCFAFDVTERD
jgi:hypothetical protein